MKVLTWVQTHLIISILLSMILGLILGALVDTSSFRDSVTLLSFLMVYPMMVTLNFRSLKEKGNVKLQVTTQLINFIFIPALAILFGLVFFNANDNYKLGILLIALLPTSGMTVSWTVMANGNVKEAIRMIVIGLILGGLLTPLYINIFMNQEAHLPFMTIISQIGLIVFLPMFLGFITQFILIKRFGNESFNRLIKPIFPKFSTFSLIILIVLVMSLRARLILSQPSILLVILIPITLGYVVMLISIHWFAKKFFNKQDRIALINGTMIRNLSLALAIALTVFNTQGPEIALIIAVAYIIQVQLAAWYVKNEIKKQVIVANI
ncbi:MAG: arsenic resistance protein [Candidatus Izemoplasmataceae bacterium]